MAEHTNIPFRNTEELSRVHYPRGPPATLQKPHQGPPLNLFHCGVGHPRRNPGAPHHSPPRPFLTRFNVYENEGSTNGADVVDRFFWWYSHFPANVQGRDSRAERRLCVVVVVCHGKGNVGMARAGRIAVVDDQAGEDPPGGHGVDRQEPVYFVEDSVYEGVFESIHYGRGRGQRTHDLQLLNCTLLKCKEHGTSWEVNVLGQKRDKEDKAEREKRDNGGMSKEVNGTMLEVLGHLLRLEREMKSVKEKKEWKAEVTKEEEGMATETKEKELMVKETWASIAK